ncbi:hypothetical protein DNK59_07665 [Pseudomonas sp. TKO26]|uniref:hypothetical protein n=1 Tax=unclassified Pseudomonas TaxID=196821 RepID=UPI000D8E650B|nr:MULTISPECIES: hypothetical protein [unclassified Pseudomonas]PYY88575.1 hypothetical protein DNK62_07665 [Pseudomonas sp. TKO30]PYY91435.1 hypothetical protein DNK61_07665 [Pseudomonas sp. TKO29]PYY94090.1 hypothetical protein DNK59_07665 [Pseudomonas sp. TKO26]PYZ00804.1 hypothetical protein DNK60_07665 [Pseudomonas sp. TKO14]
MYDLTSLVIVDSPFGLNVLQVTADLVAGALDELLQNCAGGANITQKLDYSILSLYQDKLEAAIRDTSLPPLPMPSAADSLR